MMAKGWRSHNPDLDPPDLRSEPGFETPESEFLILYSRGIKRFSNSSEFHTVPSANLALQSIWRYISKYQY